MSATPPAQPTPPAAPAEPVTPRPFNSVGLAALIVGVIALVFGIVPVLSFIAWIPALVAIGLAIAGLVIKNRRRVLPGIGLALGIFAIILGIIVSVASIAGVAGSVSDSIDEERARAEEKVPIVIEVTGDDVADIDYTITIDGKDSGEATDDVALPWRFEDEIPRGGAFDFNYYSVTVSNGDAETTISCKLTVDGEVLAEETATGSFSFISCSGSSADLSD